jgi:chemotaxis family two-component system sensor kinase Cph1
MKQTKLSKTLINTYFWVFLISWSLLIGGSMFYSVKNYRQSVFDLALAQAKGNFLKDQAFRYWSTAHGGVYVPVAPGTPPNPHLSHVPYRDIQHPDGRQLTLMNPAYMLRQLHENYSFLSGTVEHITSLKLLRPENKADEWETKALKSFEYGVKESIELSEIKGQLYLRYMKPMITVEGCLKCHGHQGYKVGDIRGGVSVSINMKNLMVHYRNNKQKTQILHSGIYLFGLMGLFFYRSRMLKKIQQHLDLQQKIEQEKERFRTLADHSYALEIWLTPDQQIKYISPSCERITGYSKHDFTNDPDLLLSIIHPEDIDSFIIHHKLEQDSVELGKVKFRIVHKNGSIRWIEHVCHPVISQDGNNLGRRISHYDITQEEEIRQQNKKLIGELTDALEQVKHLKTLLPICSHCKKIRDDNGYWEQIDDYIAEHSDTEFSHGICPDCLDKYYPEFKD